MNIQDKMQEIHHKYGVSEKANYEIQLFVEDLIKKDRAEQLILSGVVNSCTIKKEKVEDLGASYKELDRDIDDKFM